MANANAVVGVDADVNGAVRGLEKVGRAGIGMGKSLQGASRMAAGFGAGMAATGGALTSMVTIPILGASAALLELGREFDEVSRTLMKMTGKSGKALATLAKLVDKTYSKVPDSLQEVTLAYGVLTQRTDATGKHLEELATTELELSRLTGSDLNDTIRQSTRMFGDWSIASDKQVEALDRIYAASQHTGIKVTDLMETVVKFGTPLRALGFTFDESTAMLAKWEKEGVNISTILSGMKMGLGHFVAAGKDPAKALRETFDQIERAPNLAKAYDIAYKAFGQRASTDIARAVIEQRWNLAQLEKDIKSKSMTINEAAWKTYTPWEKLMILWHKLKVAFKPLAMFMIDMFVALLPYIQRTVQWITKLLKPMKKWSDDTKALIATGLALAAALGPVLAILGGIVTAIFLVIPGITALGAAFASTAIGGAIVAAFSVGGVVAGISAVGSAIVALLPVLAAAAVLIAAALAGVAAVGYIVYKNWDKIVPAVMSAASAIKSFLGDAWEYVTSAAITVSSKVQEIWPKIVQGAKSIASSVAGYFKDMYGRIKPQVTAAVELFKEKWGELKVVTKEVAADFGATVRVMWDRLKRFWNWIKPGLTWLKDSFHAAIDWISPYWKDIWASVATVLIGAFDIVITTVSFILEGLMNYFGLVMAVIRGDWDDVWNHVKELAKSWSEYMSELATGILTMLGGFLSGWQKYTELLGRISYKLIGWLLQGFWWLVKKVVGFFMLLPVRIGAAVIKLAALFFTHLPEIATFVVTIATKIAHWMGDWIYEKIVAVWGKLKGYFWSIVNGIKGVFESLSTSMQAIWANMVNKVIGYVNALIRAYNHLPGPDIGEISTLYVPTGGGISGQGTAKRVGGAGTGDALGARTGKGSSRGSRLPKVPKMGFLQGFAKALRALMVSPFQKLWEKSQLSAGGTGGLMRILSTLRGLFPGISVSSLNRPGAVTASGNTSLHALGRAADLTGPPGLMQSLFGYLVQHAKTLRAQEIIYRHAIWTPSQGLHDWPRNDHFDHVHFGVQGDGLGSGGNTYDLRGALFAEDAAKVIFELSKKGSVKHTRQKMRTLGVSL